MTTNSECVSTGEAGPGLGSLEETGLQEGPTRAGLIGTVSPRGLAHRCTSLRPSGSHTSWQSESPAHSCKQMVAPPQSVWPTGSWEGGRGEAGDLNSYSVPRKGMLPEHGPHVRSMAPLNSVKGDETLRDHRSARQCGDREMNKASSISPGPKSQAPSLPPAKVFLSF